MLLSLLASLPVAKKRPFTLSGLMHVCLKNGKFDSLNYFDRHVNIDYFYKIQYRFDIRCNIDPL